MDSMDSADSTGLQATLFDFAIAELVRQHRESFQPLWSVDSWVKLLIWLSLNCGCSGDEAGMARFVESLGLGDALHESPAQARKSGGGRGH